ncbi:MAG: indole-3-glycerol-phosphate synthase [Gemmatimonadales bacterium]|jgi:indole-3-glycerol phosphate synthase
MNLPEKGPKGKTSGPGTVLEGILAETRGRLPAILARRKSLEAAAERRPAPPSFRGALTGSGVALIAEVKRRSPSAGIIAADLDPAAHAAVYVRAGAAAVSVLTELNHFGGSLADLEMVAARVGVPVLRKDFIIDEVQLLEARAAGAAAALLIVRALPARRLRELLDFSEGLGLGALVETHTAAEVDLALEAGAGVIGVNSRDLDTFEVNVDRAWELLGQIPPDRAAVAESGMANGADVARAAGAGADAVLIGGALSALPDPAALVREITGAIRRGR